ncbi:MAG: phosphate ABC transporter substrate-binding protein PstS [Pseudonocardia sp.]
MKLNRPGGVLVATVVSALALSACGSNPGGGSGAPSAPGAPGTKCGGKATLAGEGSSAQNNAMAVFIQAYQQACDGFNVAYNPTGSGAGIKQFTAGLADFGGSDSALAPAEEGPAAARCGGNPAWNIPLVFGPVALAYKLSGVPELVLSGPTAAKIFSGGIKTWNDPAIAALNPGAQLPATPITVIFRSDESGTTDNFQKYLTASSKGAWTKGAGKKFLGGVGEGRERSAGVAQAVGQGDGAITYAELSFAKDNNLSIAKIDTGAGPVELTDATAAKAIEGAKVAGQGNDLKLDINSIYASSAPGAYPLVLATYEIVCSKGYQPDVSQALKTFLKIAVTSGQAKLSEAGYVPLPDSFKTKVMTAVEAIA